MAYSAIVCATGFRSLGVSHLLSGVGDDTAEVRVDRDYHLTIDGEPVAGLYVQGATESTHGLGSTLLSNVAVRAGEILDSICSDSTIAIAQGA